MILLCIFWGKKIAKRNYDFVFLRVKKLHNRIIISLYIFWGEKNYTTEA